MMQGVKRSRGDSMVFGDYDKTSFKSERTWREAGSNFQVSLQQLQKVISVRNLS